MKHSFLIRLAAYGFRLSILLLALTATAVMTFGTPEVLKQTLRDSGAYNAAASALARQAGQAVSDRVSPGSDTAERTNQQAAIDDAAKDSFTPASLRSATEKNIDATYAWLEGKTSRPDLEFDLRPYTDSFAQKLGNQTAERVSSLPVCTAQQLRQLDPASVNIFDLPCRPPGINLDSAGDQAANQIAASNGFLQNPVVSTDDLPKDVEGKTVVDRAASLPAAFQLATQAPWWLAVLALLCASLILLLWRNDIRAAIRKLARNVLTAGIILLVIIGIARLLIRFAADPNNAIGKLLAGSYRDVLLSFLRALEKAYDSKLLVFGIAYTVFAIVALVALRIWKRSVITEPMTLDAATANAGPVAGQQTDATSPPVNQHPFTVSSPTREGGDNPPPKPGA